MDNESILKLRKTIVANSDSYPLNTDIRLTCKGKELTDSRFTIKEYGVSNLDVITTLARKNDSSNDIEMNQDSIKYQSQPLIGMYFSKLFNLLDLEEKYSKQIFDLLGKIPTDKQCISMIVELRSDCPEPWKEKLCTFSSFKFLYFLEIIYFKCRDESGSWILKTRESGMFKFLVDQFYRNDLFLDKNLRLVSNKMCLEQVLVLLNGMVRNTTIEYKDSRKLFENGIDLLLICYKNGIETDKIDSLIAKSMLDIIFCDQVFSQNKNEWNKNVKDTDFLFQILVTSKKPLFKKSVEECLLKNSDHVGISLTITLLRIVTKNDLNPYIDSCENLFSLLCDLLQYF